jgi:hypothetical protein
MVARMLRKLRLPLVPAAAEIAPGVVLMAGGDGGLLAVHGLATFAWDGRGMRQAAAGPATCLLAVGWSGT